MIKNNQRYEEWVNRKWRPALAIQYIIVCVFDFVVAPILTFLFYYYTQGNYTQWQPITLSATGLYHLAMGTVLGVTAWQRSEEKKLRFQRGIFYDNETNGRDNSHQNSDSKNGSVIE